VSRGPTRLVDTNQLFDLIKRGALAVRTHPVRRPFLMLDECLNRADLYAALEPLHRRGLISGVGRAWYHEYRRVDGSIVVSSGYPPGLRVPEAFRLPGVVKGHRLIDSDVATRLVAHFQVWSKLIFLTENVRRDVAGIRQILETQVRPTLDSMHDGRLSLFVVFKKSRTACPDYFAGIITAIRSWKGTPGYESRYI